MKIVITGAGGLLGRHVHLRLRAHTYYCDTVVELDRRAFNEDATLDAAISNATVVVHCAGVNRGDATAVETGNIEIARKLVDSLVRTGAVPHVLYANSMHREHDSPYGRGKLAAHRLLLDWACTHDARYTEFVLPHVFGEGGKPHYNSAVHTFCHQLANSEELAINATGVFELIHAQDVAAAIVDAFERGRVGKMRLPGSVMSVATAAGKLTDFHRSYSGDVIPDIRDRLDLRLFNTLRSFMYPSFYPRPLTLHSDERGSLFECVKNLNGGQVFLSSSRPGIRRGDHYHFDKVERFLVVRGEAIIRIRALLNDHVEEFHVTGSAPAYVDMPTLHTHSITNVGDEELLTLFWSNEVFDPSKPDTFQEPVLRDEE